MTDSEIIALAAIISAEVAEIDAANKDRESHGHSMAYDCFRDDSGALLALTEEMEKRRILRVPKGQEKRIVDSQP